MWEPPAVRKTEVAMIPRLLLAAVAAYLALEGYSLLTAPPGLIREAVAKAAGGDHPVIDPDRG